ncbi:Cullin 4 [Capsaspora owczarzaki ATCC 30864]|uniref:Cullin-4 n=1 Tax=Capsaspora owczarzaki (strain ATCC 30864) TaxID=595528 RepID=A0A0D2U3S1_CAPO3|nr:Cullin 4 [Capsaspora owczarzaki ATCC 30864]
MSTGPRLFPSSSSSTSSSSSSSAAPTSASSKPGSLGSPFATSSSSTLPSSSSDPSPLAGGTGRPAAAAAAAGFTSSSAAAMQSSPHHPHHHHALQASSASASSYMMSIGGSSSARKKTEGKTLSIKGFKVAPKLPPNYEQETWQKLQAAVRAVHEARPIDSYLEVLYEAVENLCLLGGGATLYERLTAECESHLRLEAEKLSVASEDPVTFLSVVDACWQAHCEQMITIRSIFLHLDRTYVLQNPHVQSLWDVGLIYFRRQVAEVTVTQRRLITGILLLIEQERAGDSVNRSLLKSLLRMFSSLGMYTEAFEPHFLRATHELYAREGAALITTMPVPDYLAHVEARLQAESERIVHYLDIHTRRNLLATVERQLIEQHIRVLIERGFEELCNANRIADLSRFYSLLGRVNGLEPLRVAFAAYIKKRGAALVCDPEKDKNMVQDLLDMKQQLDTLLSQCFGHNDRFQNCMKESFEAFINMRQNKPAELIAKFIDAKLRAGNKEATEEELETVLDRLMILFRYIQGKDVFEAFYKNDLARRLLHNKSASVDSERAMLSKLKQECGGQFTGKLEGMFKDMDLSKAIMVSFNQSKFASQMGDIELSVSVLTQGYWPTNKPTSMNMLRIQQEFQKFYLQKHTGKQLSWDNPRGDCLVRAAFPKGTKELQVSFMQTLVLLALNAGDGVSFPTIKAETNIGKSSLLRLLQSLACGKIRVLNKNPKGRDVNETDTFDFNTDFVNKHYRLKVNQIQMKETAEENADTNEKVNQNRQYQIDAAIVRIMKARKSLAHQLLLSELFNQLKFPMKPADLKKRIESLIDREYLERDEKDQSTYIYLA